jgi:hypothetical protein
MADWIDDEPRPEGAGPAEPFPDGDGLAAPTVRGRRIWPWLLGGAGLVLAAGLGAAWLQRDTIAGNVIARQLATNGLHATYHIDRIDPGQQVLSNIVVGDPAHPDLTVAKATVTIAYRFGLPGIGSVRLEQARLYGRLIDGKPSFGSLDRVLYAKAAPGQPAGLPDLNVILDDARARIDSEYGAIGIKLQGRGVLADGFAGTLAATGPNLAIGGCTMRNATIYGKLTTRASAPRFVGPVRVERLGCPVQALVMNATTAQTDLTFDRNLGGAQGTVSLRAGPIASGTDRAQLLALDGDLGWHQGVIDARLQGSASGIATPSATIALARFDGTLRSSGRSSSGAAGRLELQGTFDGDGVQPGPQLDAAFVSAQRAAAGTLVAPMIGQVRAGLQAQRRGSRFSARFDLRRSGTQTTVAVPQARLTGGSGAVLAAVSRGTYAQAGQGLAQIAGNISTGGPGMPQITGRVTQGADGLQARLAMADYRAGGGSLAIPALVLTQARDGVLAFAGSARLTGAIPGGRAEGLALPIDGSVARNGAFALFRGCTTARFDRLTLGEMELDSRALTICPQRGQPIVRSSAAGLQVAAGTPSLDLVGRFGGAPMRLTSGAVGFAYPGSLDARSVDLALGAADRPALLRLDHLTAQLGRDFSGDFKGLEGRLAAVPLDLAQGTGQWRYAKGVLTIDKAGFSLTDRTNPARFERMIARDATLMLANGKIDAEALLREPKSDRAVVLAQVHHDLSAATGHADLAVRDLVFDKALQPVDLTMLAKGNVANAAGRIDGTGRIDWNGTRVTSTGKFTTESLDLAAAFGPVKGLKGSLVFTDLLGLVTAPNQTLQVASINPGIEVEGGTVTLALLAGQEVAVGGASWPFDGGILRLKPVNVHFGTIEERRYVLEIEGLDAARFVERMQLGNLRATGRFDGELPLVFRGDSGRIEGGHLISRAPGGNVSYVGALTYKDLSFMANFAFDALKSLDYKVMTIGMDGDLAGEIVTKVRFDGVKQGQGTKKNFITRQIARLPLQFNVNVRAPFYSLITSAKSLYDPAFIKDPRTIGLIDAQGHAIPPLAKKTNTTRPSVQTQASEKLP